MIKTFRTFDANFIKFLHSDKDIYDDMQDSSLTHDKWIPNMDPNNQIWLFMCVHNVVAGCARLQKINDIMYSVHGFAFPEFRHTHSHILLKDAIGFAQTLGIKKLLAFSKHKNHTKFAEKVGFKKIADLPKSVIRKNELIDQELLMLEI